MPDPSPIERKTLNDMTIDELDAALAQRRERRMVAFRVYEEGVESKKRAQAGRLREQLDAQLAITTREFERVDKTLAKINDRLSKIAQIRIQLEDYP